MEPCNSRRPIPNSRAPAPASASAFSPPSAATPDCAAPAAQRRRHRRGHGRPRRRTGSGRQGRPPARRTRLGAARRQHRAPGMAQETAASRAARRAGMHRAVPRLRQHALRARPRLPPGPLHRCHHPPSAAHHAHRHRCHRHRPHGDAQGQHPPRPGVAAHLRLDPGGARPRRGRARSTGATSPRSWAEPNGPNAPERRRPPAVSPRNACGSPATCTTSSPTASPSSACRPPSPRTSWPSTPTGSTGRRSPRPSTTSRTPAAPRAANCARPWRCCGTDGADGRTAPLPDLDGAARSRTGGGRGGSR